MWDIPTRNIGPWAKELIDICSASIVDRARRGFMLNNIFRMGMASGEPATYPKIYEHIDNVSSFLYSPIDLRFAVHPHGTTGRVALAKARVASQELNDAARNSYLDTNLERAVTTSLVKGKCFIKQTWGRRGAESWLVQPESMGVMAENLPSLDDQDAFFHRTYLTPSKFKALVRNLPNAAELIVKVAKYAGKLGQDGNDVRWGQPAMQIITGSMQPYQAAGGTPTTARGRVDWLEAPRPVLSPRVLASLIPIDELWVKDDRNDDWITILLVADDVVVYGADRLRNMFSDGFVSDDRRKRIQADEENSLLGMHPFTEICPNPVDDYFWGWSEIQPLALLQGELNKSVDGISAAMRIVEDPPQFLKGFQGVTQDIYRRGKIPGGYMTDVAPNAEIKKFGAELPEAQFVWLHEQERMFDVMGGMPPVLRGKGEPGIRSGVHADKATQNAAPRFMDRALLIERQVGEAGKILYFMMQAKKTETLVAWVPGDVQNIETLAVPLGVELLEAPIPGQRPVAFTFNSLPDEWRVTVDGHSGSPAFAHMAQQQAFDLQARGAMSPSELLQAVHPPNEDRLVTEAEAAAAARAALEAQHPELLVPHQGKKK